jgi:basic amino acid/polyamine antiporter, APA family
LFVSGEGPVKVRPVVESRTKVSLMTATSIVVANMIGTGVFTSLGFQVIDIRSGFALLFLWLIGGVFALCGALCYGELAAALPRSGGEFHFLSRIFHPALGFLAGWTSITVGFAAPIALAAMAFGKYFATVFPGVSPLLASSAITTLVALVHLRNLALGSAFQNVFTVLKVALILVFIVAGLAVGRAAGLSFRPSSSDLHVVMSPPFGVSLIYVMYAYSGWNASTYILGELRAPRRTGPLSLLVGTVIVAALYLGLNGVFLHTTPLDQLAGKVEVGSVAATHIFGAAGGKVMSMLISVALISCLSAMTWTGPRISQVMGEDFGLLRWLSARSAAGIPVRAVLTQWLVVNVLLLTSTFEAVLLYTQFTLNLCTLFTVLGVFVLRWRAPDLPRPYRAWGYPFTPLLFLLISLAATGYTLVLKPRESLAGLATLLAGLVIYAISSKNVPSANPPAGGQVYEEES